jgi:hypothetical protein
MVTEEELASADGLRSGWLTRRVASAGNCPSLLYAFGPNCLTASMYFVPQQPRQCLSRASGENAQDTGKSRMTPGIVRTVAWVGGTSALLLTMPFTTGCSGSHQGISAGATRDSAGVRIVELVLPRWETAPVWRTAPTPSVVIGAGRSTEHELNNVRAAVLLPDGRILVANGGPVELRLYDPDGTFTGRIGREGAGPGEFRRIASVQRLAGDTILIFDPGLRRATVLSLDGTHLQSVVLAPQQSSANPLGLHSILGRFSDGSFLAEGVDVVPSEGLVVPRSRLGRLTPRLDSAVAVGEFPGSHMAFAPSATGGLMFWDPMFGRRTYYLVDSDGFWFAHSESWEHRRYHASGNLQLVVRVVRDPYDLTRGDIEKVLDSIAQAQRRNPRFDRERARSEISLYATLPAFAAVMLDADRNLWLREYPRPGQDRGRWTVFGRDGGFRAFAATLPGTRVLSIARDGVLVLGWSATGEEQVLQYRLDKGDGAH